MAEVKVSEHDRSMVHHNPEVAERAAAVKANLVERLDVMIADTDRPAPTRRAEMRG